MKIGFVSLPYTGHVNPMIALARKMQSRGNEVVFIGVPDVGPSVRAGGLPFVPYCEKEFPDGSSAHMLAPHAKLHGIETIRRAAVVNGAAYLKAGAKHLAHVLAANGVEALVLDALHRYLELVPLSRGMPYAQVWNTLPIDMSGTTPPCSCSLPYCDTSDSRTQYLEHVRILRSFHPPLLDVAAAYAAEAGLDIDWTNPGATVSKLAIVSQVPKEFDFPANPWPPNFHYTGPFVDEGARLSTFFPWEKLDGRPLIYASLGTILNGISGIYETILSALGKLPDVQAVLSIGNNVQRVDLGPIPPNITVVGGAPQIELLRRSSLCITHAGLNTALECLAQGVPMVAIPIGFDQPGVAARIRHHQVGEFLEVDELSVEKLSDLVRKVLKTPIYHDHANNFRNIISQRRGLEVAAEIIEHALEKEFRWNAADNSVSSEGAAPTSLSTR